MACCNRSSKQDSFVIYRHVHIAKMGDSHDICSEPYICQSPGSPTGPETPPRTSTSPLATDPSAAQPRTQLGMEIDSLNTEDGKKRLVDTATLQSGACSR